MRILLAVLLLATGTLARAGSTSAPAAAAAPAAAPAQASAAPCSQPIRFVADWFPDPKVDLTKSASNLVALGAPVGNGGTALGLVTVENAIAVTPEKACRGIVVRLSFVNPVLRVARELPPDTCAHEHVLHHEYTHVRIYREMAREFRALVYPWPDDARSAAVLRYAQQQLAKLQEAQRQFDSPQEYAENSVACHGEIPRLLAAARK